MSRWLGTLLGKIRRTIRELQDLLDTPIAIPQAAPVPVPVRARPRPKR